MIFSLKESLSVLSLKRDCCVQNFRPPGQEVSSWFERVCTGERLPAVVVSKMPDLNQNLRRKNRKNRKFWKG